MKLDEILSKGTTMIIEYSPKVLMAVATLIVGFWIIRRLMNLLDKGLQRSGMDESLSKFMSSLASVMLKVMVLLSVAGMFGVNTTSFIAILGGLMVGVGMALNGSLGNVAAGVMLMIFKPFKVGDLVEIGGGHTGSVESINAFNTSLATLDNKRIYVSNSNVTGNTITNISGQGTVGVELTYGIGYNDSIDKAREIILKVGKDCPYILDTPAQGVVVANLGDNAVDLATRPFCNSEHYWDVLFYMQEHVKKEFDKAGVGIPYPQMDVHVVSQN
ncbi:MAG: mechanosensitive ion channel family protein [Saprospiraceae bacterium]